MFPIRSVGYNYILFHSKLDVNGKVTAKKANDTDADWGFVNKTPIMLQNLFDDIPYEIKK